MISGNGRYSIAECAEGDGVDGPNDRYDDNPSAAHSRIASARRRHLVLVSVDSGGRGSGHDRRVRPQIRSGGDSTSTPIASPSHHVDSRVRNAQTVGGWEMPTSQSPVVPIRAPVSAASAAHSSSAVRSRGRSRCESKPGQRARSAAATSGSRVFAAAPTSVEREVRPRERSAAMAPIRMPGQTCRPQRIISASAMPAGGQNGETPVGAAARIHP